MGAHPEAGFAVLASAEGLSAVARAMRDADRRAVAIAPDATELLRPSSDLGRLLESFGRADILLAADSVPIMVDDDDPDDWAHEGEDVRACAAALAHPDLAVHRLGLGHPIGSEAEDLLVAAISELIGFDPEPGVYCLAPATPPNGPIARAAQRIARVYGLPLLRYRCLELSVVDPDISEAG
jgi:hypothetical protein